MLRIWTLGQLRVTTGDAEVAWVHSQRRRAALLMLLALEGPIPRDRITALLWPDSSPDHARRALNQAVYDLRRLAGEAVGVVVTPQGIVLAGPYWVDALAFEQACKTGAENEALDLYRGEFLAGSRLSDSPAFEQWVEARGAALRRQHRTLRRQQIARRIEADELTAALAAARAWVAVEPEEDEAHHRVIELLAATGERAEAIRHYESYRRQLEEQELTPLDETVALIGSLRDGEVALAPLRGPIVGVRSPSGAAPAPPGAGGVADRSRSADETFDPREAPAPSRVTPAQAAVAWARRRPLATLALVAVMATGPLAAWAGWSAFGGRPATGGEASVALDPELIAVFPFRVNVTDPALGYLREGMVDLLHVKLGAVRRSVDPRSLLAAWRAAGGDDAEPPLNELLRLAAGLSAGRVLLGSVVGSPENLTVNATLYEVPRGRELATTSLPGRIDVLTSLIDRLAAELVSLEAGETADRLEMLTTTSLPALRAYLDGMAAYRRGRYQEAASRLLTAVAADSTFALAAMYLFEASTMAVGGVEGVPDVAALVRTHRDRLGPRDRLFSLARFPEPGTTGAACLASCAATDIERWEAVIPQLHDKPEAWFHFGDMLFHYGAWQGIDDNLARAKHAFSRALALDSSYFSALHHLIWIARTERDTLFAAPAMRRYLEADPAGDAAGEFRFNLALFAGDTVAMAGLIEGGYADLESLPFVSLVGFAGVPPITLGLDNAVYDDIPFWRPEPRLRAIELAVQRATSQSARSSARSRQAMFYQNLGLPLRADSVLAVMALDPGAADAVDRARIFNAIYWDGDAGAAERASQRLSRLPAPTRDDLYALAEWNLWHGWTAGVREQIARIREPGATATDLLYAQILEAHLAHLEGWPAADSVLLALDASLKRPDVAQVLARGNLTLVRISKARNDLPRALSASRRVMADVEGNRYYSTFMLERARVLAALGRHLDAERLYRRYLMLRYAPEPSLEPLIQQVRAELADSSGRRAP